MSVVWSSFFILFFLKKGCTLYLNHITKKRPRAVYFGPIMREKELSRDFIDFGTVSVKHERDFTNETFSMSCDAAV